MTRNPAGRITIHKSGLKWEIVGHSRGLTLVRNKSYIFIFSEKQM